MVSQQKARRATTKRMEKIILESLFEGITEFDITPESLYNRIKKKSKHALKTSKKAKQDLGKSLFGIGKDLLGF